MEVSLRRSDRIIVQYGTSLDERDDCDIEKLTDEQADELRALIAEPNGGITLAEDGTLAALPPSASAEPGPDPDDELALAIEGATTLDELKKALLGQTKAAAAKGRLVE